MVEKALEREGYAVFCAGDGPACLEMTRREAPDLILLDVLMPGMDGDEVCRRLKADPDTARVPILMMSTSEDEDRIIDCLDAGAHDFITKPINTRVMLARVRSALRVKEADDQKEQMLSFIENTDPMLEIGNRRSMELELDRIHSTARRYGRPYAVGLMDVDHFKPYNDRYGHRGGDEILSRICSVAKDHLRGSDELYRYGGEEFLFLMPETGLEGAEVVAERQRSAIEALALEHADSPHGIVTISVGVSWASGDEVPPTWEQLVQRADEALYAAKEAGRNRVIVK
jgi:diguanylate cyclase (GGDEF)-like protein